MRLKNLLLIVWLSIASIGAIIGINLSGIFQYCWGVIIGSICSAIFNISMEVD